MAEAITSLTLEINTQSVDEASKKLDAFSKKAEEAAVATDELTAAKKRSKKMTDEEIRDFERVYQNVMKAVKASEQEAEQERRLAAARKKLAESGDRLYTSYRNQIDGLKNINTASKELEKITEQVRASYRGGTLDINNYRQLLGDIAIKQKEVTVAETLATKAKVDFINKLKAQVANQNLTKQQLLSYQAAQLGVSSSADIYIKKISQATTATKNYETATRTAKNQAAKMQMQLMRGNFSGINTLGVSMIMKNGIGNTVSTLLTSLNPLNIGLAAMVGLLGSMIPKLFETEDATEKLAAAQERLNKVMSTDKQSGMAFLSDDMMSLLSKNQALVKAALKSSEKDLKTVISSAKQDLQDGLKGIEHGWTEWLTGFGTNNQSGLNNVLDQIAQIKSSGLDLNSMLSSSDLAMYNFVSGIKGKIENYADYFNITHEQAQAILEQMADIKSETDSLKASEKINKLISEISTLYTTSNNDSKNLEPLINALVKIAEKSEDAALKVKMFRAQQKNLEKAIDPKKSPFYKYSQMAMNPKQRADAEIKDMEAAANEANKIYKPTDEGYVTKDKIKAAAQAIKDRYKEKGRTSVTDLLQSSRQQEISLMNQLKALREEALTVNTITSERKKYYDLQAQIEVLESKTDKSKLTAQEKYILGHKEALLAQQAKNAAISEEIAQYETATKALRKMKEYTSNVITTAGIKQATFGMTQKQAGREEELIRLNKNQNDELAKITDPVQVSEVTKKYTEAKEALQQSWQQEDQNQGDWITGMKVGLSEFAEDGQNVFKGFRDVAGNAMNSISHSLTELVTTGKMDFKSLTKSILTNIIEIINKLLVAQAIQSAMGWMGGSSGSAGAATGGLQQAYTGGLIRGYANGGGVGYNDEPGGFTGIGNKYQPAGIVHKGEFVFTKEATKRLGVANLYALMREAQHGYANGGGVKISPASPVAFTGKTNNSSSAINVTTNVAINMQSNSSSQAQIGNIDKRALEGQIKPIIQKNVSEVLQKSTSPGGELYILLNR
ncbi:phage tail tape measure protein [Gilliamella apicola]|uniref:phage tail tape measure protein n=1 Tax=Gilliamella apicola TaxID=1196095 RepID=UPI000A34998D|nr:phage tail tape measure protein [Gilliamella apicola]OTP93751.1 phage tail tape measure protein [Gilliamella apicola]OTQ00718.1 phage tail tape measure protein [Gilliamella apicola]OTQ27481.1 phage tail tape measure protein [Gilliamella apicola]